MRHTAIAIGLCWLLLAPVAFAQEGARIFKDAASCRRPRPAAERQASPKAPPKYSPVHDTALCCRYYGYSYSTNDFWGTPQTPLLYTYQNLTVPPAASYPVKIGFDDDWYNEHSRGHLQFDLGALPDSVTALAAGLRLTTAYDTQWPHEWDSWTDVPVVLRGMWRDQAAYTPHDGDASSWDLYDDAGDGSGYGTHDLTMDGTYNVEWPAADSFYDLGAQAVSDLNASWTAGRFGIGLALPDESADRGINLWGAGAYLHVTYKHARSHPRLSSPSVAPAAGEAGITMFSYTVDYADSFGYPADSAWVTIDGARTLALSPTGDPTDCRFIGKTVLAAPGAHTYAFRFHNTFGRTAELPASGSFGGPTVSLHPGPYVQYVRSAVIDTGSMGNGDGVLNSGETARLRVWVRNMGSDSAGAVTGTLSTGDPNIGVIVAADTFGTVPSLDSAGRMGFTVAAAAATPFNYTASLVLRCRDRNGDQWASNVLLPVNALFFEDAEDSSGRNVARQDSPWHRTQRRSYSPDHAWWCGEEGTGAYAANSNAALVTTEFVCGHDQELSFWHWYETEPDYDSCFVESTVDGGAHWSTIAAYNGTSAGWAKQACDLSAIAAGTPLQVRFRFKSDNSVNRHGWFIDDIRVGPAAAALGNGLLTPSIGDTAQQFAYSVTYTSAANAPPTDSTVVIDGVAHAMSRNGGTYAAGARYSYATRLPLGDRHTYLFYFSSDGQPLQSPSSGYGDGPWVGAAALRDDLESGLAKWTVGHSGNSLDWSLTAACSHSPSHCLTDSRDTTYRDSTDSWAGLVNSVDLSSYTWAKIGWFERYWTEAGYDSCSPEISADNGATWTALCPKYSGLDTAWHERVADLGAYCGKAAPVKVRYHLTSDHSIHYDGWYVDDVQIIGGWPTGVNDPPPDESRSQEAEFRMGQNYPNPFAASTTVRYQLPAAGRVMLTIYNVAGQVVKPLTNEVQSAGPHLIRWDGRDVAGRRAAAGIYFYRLTTGERTITKKMIVVK
ncbi:MAG TPA: T9SS type A sorting domain-containing protein [Candidatus Edwardsbacteria bacterium]|nr:T9SS type A sorting domain-containing protein [Candidatus Edwardsbacteria bacterium]